MKNPFPLIIAALLLTLLLTLLPAQSATQKKNSSEQCDSATRKSPTATDHAEAEKVSAKKLLSSLTPTQKSKLLALLNQGSNEELGKIKGVAETRAASIVKARPFKGVEEVILVDGVGESTFTNVIAHAKTLPRRKSTAKKS